MDGQGAFLSIADAIKRYELNGRLAGAQLRRLLGDGKLKMRALKIEPDGAWSGPHDLSPDIAEYIHFDVGSNSMAIRLGHPAPREDQVEADNLIWGDHRDQVYGPRTNYVSVKLYEIQGGDASPPAIRPIEAKDNSKVAAAPGGEAKPPPPVATIQPTEAEDDDSKVEALIKEREQLLGGLRLIWVLRNYGADRGRAGVQAKTLGKALADDDLVYVGRKNIGPRTGERTVTRYHKWLSYKVPGDLRERFFSKVYALIDAKYGPSKHGP